MCTNWSLVRHCEALMNETLQMWFKQQSKIAALGFLAVSLIWIACSQPSSARAEASHSASSSASPPASAQASPPATARTGDSWSYPLVTHDVLRDFWSPNGDYSAGHRGIDFAATESEPVSAVADGVVRFAGSVAGRGVLSITLANGYVAELEPVCPLVAAGESVTAGQQIATVCTSGETHCAETCLHLSARRFSADYPRGFAYLTPLLFLRAFRHSHLVAIGSLN